MKKLLFALAAVSLIAGTSLTASAHDGSDGREKISGPSEIRNFKDIVKEGKDMFGFRIAASLQRILNPGEMKNFEGIRKMGNSLWGYRKMSGSAMVTVEARACVGAAITKKDNTVKNALSSFTTNTNAAISARTSCQINAIALGSTAEQQSANAKCTMDYQASAKTNLKSLVDSRNNAWKTYKTEIKACTGSSTEIKLEDGGNLENAL